MQYDHLHLVLAFPPKYSVSEVVGFFKGKSAIKLFDRWAGLKKRCWRRHFWSKGYCVNAVGLNEEQSKEYVKYQQNKEHDAEKLKFWNHNK